jgi:hypothetical protein
MNTKEIASAVNKDERSVRRWINKASDKVSVIKDKMSASSPMKPADYNLIETCLIIEQVLGKNAADIFRMNATHGTSQISIESRLDRLEALIEKIMIVQLNNTIPGKQLTFNDVPEKSKRSELREIINKYTADRGCNHIEVWTQLYQQIYYRMNINVQLCAKNRGMDKLDYIEKEGLLNEVVSLAKKLFEVK